MTNTDRGSGPAVVRATAFFVVLIATLSAIGQLATNIYLPSLPFIAIDLSASLSETQLTLSVYLAALALTPIVFGPVSDRFGRKIVLILGLVIFLLGSIICYLAPDIRSLITGRAVQALGGGCCSVAARAVLRDCFEGAALQKIMVPVTILFALVPGLAPLLGGLMHEFFHWRVVFAFVGAIAVLILPITLFRLPETNRNRLSKLNMAEVFRGYAEILSNREFVRYALASGMVFAAMFAFFGGSPQTFIEHLGLTPTEYGFFPPFATLGFVIGGITVRRLTGRTPPDGIVVRGILLQIFATAFAVVGTALGFASVTVYVTSVVLVVTGLGIMLPTAMASALDLFPRRAGAASAMLGFMQMAGGGLGSALVAIFQDDFPLMGFPVIMLAATVLAMLCFVALRPTR